MNSYSIALKLMDSSGYKMELDYTNLHYFLTLSGFSAMLSTNNPCYALQYLPKESLNNDALEKYAEAVCNTNVSCDVLFLDARDTVYGPNRGIEVLFEKLLYKYKFIYLMACPEILSKLQDTISKSSHSIIPTLGLDMLTMSRSGCIAPIELADVQTDGIDCMVRKAILTPAIGDTTGNDRIAITSSNVYANLYFDARQLFRKSVLFGHAIDWFCQTIIKQNTSIDMIPDALICSSANGSCLAGAISAWLDIPIVYLKNIGPSMNTHDDAIALKLKKGYRYIYVFDFMCMGSEQQRVKTLCAIRNAKLLYSIGLSMYRVPMSRDGTRETDPKDILVIDKIENITKYECYPDKA